MNEVTTSNTPHEKEPASGFAVIPYIQGVTEPIKRILNSHNVYVAQKPFQTLGHVFAKPKDPITNEKLTDVFILLRAMAVITSISDRPNFSLVDV